MKANVDGTDRVIRIVLGVAILIVGYILKSWWGLIGLVPLITGLIGWCPLYIPLGISTKKE